MDFFLDQGALKVAGVEFKGGATVRSDDFAGLRKLKSAPGENRDFVEATTRPPQNR